MCHYMQYLTQIGAAVPPIGKHVFLPLVVVAILASIRVNAGYFDQTPLVLAAIQQDAASCSGNMDCSTFADKLLNSTPAAVCTAIATKRTDSLTKIKANSDKYVQAISIMALKIGADNVPVCAQHYIPIPDEH